MNSEFHSLFLFTRADIGRMITKNTASGKDCDCSYVDEMSGLLKSVMYTIDDIIVSAGVMWNALFLVHLIHSINVHVSNIEACHEAADAKGSPVFRFDVDYIRIRCHLDNILAVCRYNMSRMCTEGVPVSHRDRRLKNGSMIPVQDSMGLKRTVSTNILIPRNTSPLLSVTRRAPVQPIRPDRVDPLLQTQLNNMKRLSRKFTSRDLMGLHTVMSDALEPGPSPAITTNTLPTTPTSPQKAYVHFVQKGTRISSMVRVPSDRQFGRRRST